MEGGCKLAAAWMQPTAMQGTLRVALCKATSLCNVEWKGLAQDPYCEIKVGNRKLKSFVHTDGGTAPVWNQMFVFEGVTPEQDLKLKIKDKNGILKDANIGTCVLPLREIVGRSTDGEVHLFLPVIRADGKGYQGQVEVKLQYIPHSAGGQYTLHPSSVAPQYGAQPSLAPAYGCQPSMAVRYGTQPSMAPSRGYGGDPAGLAGASSSEEAYPYLAKGPQSSYPPPQIRHPQQLPQSQASYPPPQQPQVNYMPAPVAYQLPSVSPSMPSVQSVRSSVPSVQSMRAGSELSYVSHPASTTATIGSNGTHLAGPMVQVRSSDEYPTTGLDPLSSPAGAPAGWSQQGSQQLPDGYGHGGVQPHGSLQSEEDLSACPTLQAGMPRGPYEQQPVTPTAAPPTPTGFPPTPDRPSHGGPSPTSTASYEPAQPAAYTDYHRQAAGAAAAVPYDGRGPGPLGVELRIEQPSSAASHDQRRSRAGSEYTQAAAAYDRQQPQGYDQLSMQGGYDRQQPMSAPYERMSPHPSAGYDQPLPSPARSSQSGYERQQAYDHHPPSSSQSVASTGGGRGERRSGPGGWHDQVVGAGYERPPPATAPGYDMRGIAQAPQGYDAAPRQQPVSASGYDARAAGAGYNRGQDWERRQVAPHERQSYERDRQQAAYDQQHGAYDRPSHTSQQQQGVRGPSPRTSQQGVGSSGGGAAGASYAPGARYDGPGLAGRPSGDGTGLPPPAPNPTGGMRGAAPTAKGSRDQWQKGPVPATPKIAATPRSKARDWILRPPYCDRDCSNDYEDWAVIGHGYYADTFRAIKKGTHRAYAIKVISKRRLGTEEERAGVVREIQMLKKMEGHPNVVRLYDVWETRQEVSLCMELCSGGELFDAIVERGHYSERDAASIMRTIVRVVADMHARGIMHRDLKPENFLFSDKTLTATVKTADFGCATSFQRGVMLREVAGSTQYVAPEVLAGSYGPEADMWSCGCCLYALLSGTTPFPANNEQDLVYMINTKRPDLNSYPWTTISAPAKDCVRRLLVKNPEQRATASEILQHEWLREDGVASDAPIVLEVLERLKKFCRMNKLKKQALKVIAAGLPVHEVTELRQLFIDIDVDRSGTISVDEFAEALKRKGRCLKRSDVESIMAAADLDGDHQLDYEEFVAVMMNHAKLQQEENLKKAFEHFDLDGNGKISRSELYQCLQQQGLERADIPRIISEADRDGDGQINYDEFCLMLRRM